MPIMVSAPVHSQFLIHLRFLLTLASVLVLFSLSLFCCLFISALISLNMVSVFTSWWTACCYWAPHQAAASPLIPTHLLCPPHTRLFPVLLPLSFIPNIPGQTILSLALQPSIFILLSTLHPIFIPALVLPSMAASSCSSAPLRC